MDYEFKALRGTRTKCLLVLAIPQPIPVPSWNPARIILAWGWGMLRSTADLS